MILRVIGPTVGENLNQYTVIFNVNCTFTFDIVGLFTIVAIFGPELIEFI